MLDEMKIRLGKFADKEIEKWVNQKTKKEGNTGLHFASYRGNLDIIDKLIKNKANIKLSNFTGSNVLHMAAKGNNLNSFIYFKEKFNMNIESVDDMDSTPLHRACFFGADLVTNFILNYNVNFNHKDREGFTPLHLATIAGINSLIFLDRGVIIKRLLQKGANKSIKDNKGRTALDISLKNSNHFIIGMLEEKSSCQIFEKKMPLKKLEKNRIYIFIFFLYYFLSGFSTECFLIPCNNSLK